MKLLSTLILLLALGLPALATPEGGPPAPGQTVDHKNATGPLRLTQEQQNRIREIRKTIPQGPERREAMMKVLTPEQRAALKARLGNRPHSTRGHQPDNK